MTRRAPPIAIRWPDEAARSWCEHFLRNAPSDRTILAVVGFGSAFRSTRIAPADLDLLVVRDQAGGADWAPPMSVDLRAYERAEVEPALAHGHELLGWAIRFGVVLHEKDGYWSCLRQAWTDRIPLPSAQTALDRARRIAALVKDLSESGDADAAEEMAIASLTQFGRHLLLGAGVLPLTRPELPGQLEEAGFEEFARILETSLHGARAADLIGSAETLVA